MGMFDYVNYECDCPYCDTKLPDFQSKESYCRLKTLLPEDVGNFYTMCDNCGTWVEFINDKGEFTLIRELV